jgi:hypothetical protein
LLIGGGSCDKGFGVVIKMHQLVLKGVCGGGLLAGETFLVGGL